MNENNKCEVETAEKEITKTQLIMKCCFIIHFRNNTFNCTFLFHYRYSKCVFVNDELSFNNFLISFHKCLFHLYILQFIRLFNL